MNNQQKAKLRGIAKGIPVEEYSKGLKWLHQRYGYDFTYSTFVSYFKCFKKEDNK